MNHFSPRIIPVNLSDNQVDIPEIERSLEEFKVLLFPNQKSTNHDKLVSFCSKLGEIPLAPKMNRMFVENDKVSVLSNSTMLGYAGAGSQWHNDGAWRAHPTSYTMYIIAATPEQGSTVFCNTEGLLNSLPNETLDKWYRLSFCYPDSLRKTVQPMVVHHPKSNCKMLLLHMNVSVQLIWDYGTENERELEIHENRELLTEIKATIESNPQQIYEHKWNIGDILLVDNWATLHKGGKSHDKAPWEIGLRTIHRIDILGTDTPRKYKPSQI